MGRGLRLMLRAPALGVVAPMTLAGPAPAQEPELLDPDLAVRTAVSGLSQPVAMAFVGRGDMLVLEKASGQVKRVVDGEARGVVLDLAVNSASERGLLGIALHPRFRRNGWVYLFWSESRTGADSTALDGVRLLGNRVDRFEWDGEALEFDRNIIQFRSRRTRTSRCAATTTAACCGSGPTASCTRSSATPAAAGRCRTWSTGRSARASRMTSSAGPSLTTRTAPVRSCGSTQPYRRLAAVNRPPLIGTLTDDPELRKTPSWPRGPPDASRGAAAEPQRSSGAGRRLRRRGRPASRP